MALIKRTAYTAVGAHTHTFEPGRKWCRVICTGGGSSGRFQHANHAGNGGGAGGTAIKIIQIAGSTADVVVGAGGANTGQASYTINPGGTSSFSHNGVSFSATGGYDEGIQFGGDFATKGGLGVGGDINIIGGCGLGGQSKYIHGNNGTIPGQSFWGEGAADGNSSFGTYGAGGFGTDGTGIDGVQNGYSGIVVVEEYL
jgi:hypothetical protein